MKASAVLQQRRSGVLLHLSSLPGSPGNGDLGHDAFRFVDWLADAGFGVWQMLPLGPTHSDGSPYQCLSVHAGDPRYINLALLEEHGWLQPASGQPDGSPEAGVVELRLRRLNEARVQFRAGGGELSMDGEGEAAEFRRRHRYWLEDFALYMALRREKGEQPWWEWPAGERDRVPAALDQARERLCDAMEQVVFEQYLFFHQWDQLRRHGTARGITFFGDMPIFVAHDSAEVWANRELFAINEQGHAEAVAGVPPDYFSETGQFWGNPHYDWKRLEETGFDWWLRRLATQLELFDFVRLDHFRGLAAYWSIPATAETAMEGHWEPAPGQAFLEAVSERFGQVPLVAEDLGVITEDVDALREAFHLPGMKILQFAFDSDAHNPYLPHHHVPNGVVYTGTHDNDTTVGWYTALEPAIQARIADYLGQPGEGMPWPLLRSALASVAGLAILPMQDLLGLDGGHRMNTPGVAEGNWQWRFEWDWLAPELADRLASLNRLYGRCD